MRKILGVFAVAGTLLAAACNTVEGVGEDVSSAGRTVSNAASDVKN